jgi:hypothetical protein
MKPHNRIDALELLRSQHTEVDELIVQIEGADPRGNKRALFEQLADKLAAHATIEEKIFYPAVMTVPLHQQLVEATEEHLAVKRLLADMMELDCDNKHFDAKLTVLKECVRHHAHDEEEGQLFLEVEDLLDDDQLAALGNELLVMFEALIERAPRNNVRAETRRAAELHA